MNNRIIPSILNVSNGISISKYKSKLSEQDIVYKIVKNKKKRYSPNINFIIFADMKITTTKQQDEFFQIYGMNVNKKYYFFPKVYIRTDNNEYDEVDLKDLPEGVQKYIKSKSE